MVRLIDRCVSILLVALGLLLIAMVLLSVWNAVSRYVLGSALLWGDEVATFGLIVLTYLGAVASAWRGDEIRMDVLLNPLPARVRAAVMLVQNLVVCLLCGWVAWLSWAYVERVFRIGMTSTGSGLPLWAIHGVLTLSFALFALIALGKVLRQSAVFSGLIEPRKMQGNQDRS